MRRVFTRKKGKGRKKGAGRGELNESDILERNTGPAGFWRSSGGKGNEKGWGGGEGEESLSFQITEYCA